MSTKIWEAYRIPISRINDFIDIARDQARAEIFRCVTAMVESVTEEAMMKEMLKHSEFYSSETAKKDYMENTHNKLSARFDIVKKVIKAAAQSRHKTPYDIGCWINFWVDGEHAYIIPVGACVTGLKYPEWVEDFHYQNQTDKPKRISQKEWNKRRDTWEQINLGVAGDKSSHNARRLCHEIFDPSDSMSLTELEFEMVWRPRIEKKVAS